MLDSQLPKVMTIKEVAEYLKINEESIMKEIESGRLRGFQVDSQWRTTDSDLLAYIRGQTKNMEPAFAESEQGLDQNSDWEIRDIEPFDFSWPKTGDKNNVEHYDEAYEATRTINGQQLTLKIGFGNREVAGLMRRRGTIWLGNRAIVEFAGSNDFDKTGKLASVIRLRNNRQLTPFNRIPPEYSKYKIKKYNSVIKGPRASTNMAIVVHKDDLKSMLDHALIRATWKKLI
jgi:excisionase family DNA binding protein